MKIIKFYEEEIDSSAKLLDDSKILEIVNNRWCFLNTEAHEFGFILSPRNVHLFDQMPNDDYKQTIKRFKIYCRTYYENHSTASEAIKQFTNYLADIKKKTRASMISHHCSTGTYMVKINTS